MKHLLTPLLLASLSFASPGPLPPSVDYTLQLSLSGLRGFRDGYLNKMHLANKWAGDEIPPHSDRGLNDTRCFGKESEGFVYEVASFFWYGELYQIGTVLDDLSNLFSDTTQFCLVQETSQMIRYKCYGVKEECDLIHLAKNLINHKLLLLEVAENIIQLLMGQGAVWEDGVATKEEVYGVMEDAGSDIASVIISTFGL
ncbi:hypothetical protein FGO68_gene12394 [Halteria grandinella]|uniref:Uncharacterized protein n=1 Tax=Halteria grandinella TaxID=5974 RepID=A0A8J8NP87_HALGN|nr:hypothetical protein FGO68_gene12394 [Halteria grandinella]